MSSPRHLALAALGILVSAAALPASSAAAMPTDADLLAAIQDRAPDTIDIAQVVPATGDGRIAIRTHARGAGDAGTHDELWSAAADGAELSPVSRSAGSAAEFVSIGSLSWSADGATLIYGYANHAVPNATAARAVRFGPAGTPSEQSLGSETYAPAFTADGRYVTFFQDLGSTRRASGALDLASRTVLLPARIDTTAPDGTDATPAWYAPECARAATAGWVPAAPADRWLDGALSSPDPGCRFGANAGDPAPAATPDVSGADDAPASITRTVGPDLVTIAERTAKPLGPSVRIRSSAKGLTRALRRGLRVKLDVAGARTLKAYVIAHLPADDDTFGFAGSSDVRDYTLGRFTKRNPPSQAQTISIPFTKQGRRTLPRFLKITVTLRIAATDRAGNRTVVEQPVALTDF